MRKKFFKDFMNAASAILLGLLALLVLNALAADYRDALKATGGMVTAGELLYIEVAPYVGSALFAYACYCYLKQTE